MTKKLLYLYRIARLAKDPLDTARVFQLSDELRRSVTPDERRRMNEAYLEDPDFRTLYEARAEPGIFSGRYDLAALRALAPGTLGREYAEFMERHGLDPEFYPAIHEDDPVACLINRIRRTHDIWHVVAGFDADVAGEIGLMGFYSRHVHPIFPASIAIAGILHACGTRDREKITRTLTELARGIQAGGAARNLIGVRWEKEWATPVAELRTRFRIAV
jgi:ubiquinone biosynthesis protein COQ4